jgi:hypothetical protein
MVMILLDCPLGGDGLVSTTNELEQGRIPIDGPIPTSLWRCL